MTKEKIVSILDVRIMLSVAICALSATLLSHFGLTFSYKGMNLEILQKMTSCIACLLCVQDSPAASWKAGVNRLIITAIGGACGMVVALIDTAAGSVWLMALMVALGVFVTLILCKKAKVPYINARIGGVTFVLVACTLSAHARLWYALFRFVSTFYGVLIVMLVSALTKKLDTVK